MAKWHEDNSTLVSLAIWLNHDCDYFEDVSAVIYFFEKPWKYDREHALWQAWVFESDRDRRERIIVAVIEDESIDSVRAEWEEEEAELSPEEIAEIKGDMEFHRRRDEGEL